MPPIRRTNAAQIQRSACDSCRTHKIRCMRDGKGDVCTRCDRLEMNCTTSLRSRMGRPPQRGGIETAEDSEERSTMPGGAEDSLAAQPLGTVRQGEIDVINVSFPETKAPVDCPCANSDDYGVQDVDEGMIDMSSVSPDVDWSWLSPGIRVVDDHTELVTGEPSLQGMNTASSIGTLHRNTQSRNDDMAQDITNYNSTKWSTLPLVTTPDTAVEKLSILLRNISKLLQCLQEDRVQESGSPYSYGPSFINQCQEFATLLSGTVSDSLSDLDSGSQTACTDMSESCSPAFGQSANLRLTSSVASFTNKRTPTSDVVSTMLVVSCYTQLVRTYDTIMETILTKLLNESPEFNFLNGMESAVFPLLSNTGRITVFMQLASHIMCHVESCLGLSGDYRVIKSVLSAPQLPAKSIWAAMYEKLDLEDSSKYRKSIKKHIKAIKQLLETRSLF